MSIVFFCRSCGSRFEVDARLSGKAARCKKCGQRTNVPKPTELASTAALPAAPALPAPAAEPEAAAGEARAPSRASWIAAATSNLALAPLTGDGTSGGWGAALKPKPSPMDQAEGEDPELDPMAAPTGLKHRGGPSKAVKGGWRNELVPARKLLRWLNETSFLVSLPFLMMILLGVMLKNRQLAILGATVAVLLNVGRFAVGLADLVAIPFRESLAQGALFLIPPLMFVYAANHWKNVEKAVKRVAGPALTIGLIVLAFAIVPLLRGDGPTGAPGANAKAGAGAGDPACLDASGEESRAELRPTGKSVVPEGGVVK